MLKLFSLHLKQSGMFKSEKELIYSQLTKSNEYALDELMSGIRDENKHDRIDFGPPKGKELL